MTENFAKLIYEFGILDKFMWKVAEFGGLIGVSSSTLRRWETEGKLTPCSK
jgi:DNA-binding transcriptional regulator YiaG